MLVLICLDHLLDDSLDIFISYFYGAVHLGPVW